ncbi:phosphoribosyltransferase [Ovoidimarina sediminis]|uniref:phosphoribosyltransferase n=1 Tax=Ovoidimarina sediminis TaxID=3079856 RepID=UPI00290CC8B2|nr:phosphoribosyltransferase family protein [Rhodophyticola sp. MJ-SS7]MDU8943589.1 phosphoribosyltransferase family protein [Rhodophyticola sp. MJ-SS7]
MAMFENRADAGRQLAAALPETDPDSTVVIALPRGGVPVAAEICAARHLPMDIVLVRKIGAPGQPELAVGAVVDGDRPEVTVNTPVARQFGLSRPEVEGLSKPLLEEIERRRLRYLGDRPRPEIAGKTLIVVDDGVATGTTLRASLAALKARNPAEIIVAVPVGPNDLKARLAGLADRVICLGDLSWGAVGASYRAFEQVDDGTVETLLKAFAPGG